MTELRKLRVAGLRRAVLIPGALVGAVGLWAWWPQEKPTGPREVNTDPFVRLRGGAEYAPTVSPGTYSWTSVTLTASPVGARVIIYDYETAACLVNVDGASEYVPPVEPQRKLVIENEPGLSAVRWQVGLQRLDKGYGDLWVIERLGDNRRNQVSAGVPFQSAFVGSGDMHTNGLVGCSALCLTDGATTIFAHCLGRNAGYVPENLSGAFTVSNVFARIDRFLTGKSWVAFIASGDREDGESLSKMCETRGIEVREHIAIGNRGHSAWFCARTQSFHVVPSTIL